MHSNMIDRRQVLKGGLAATLLGAVPSWAQSARVKAPFPIFDTHAHFYTPDTAKYPPKGDITQRAMSALKSTPMTHEVVVKQYWEQAGITKGTGVQYNTVYGTDNTYVIDVGAADPRRVLPVVILPATDPATADTLRRMTRENRIAGVRLFGSPVNGEFEFFADAALPAWKAVDELGIAMVLMLVGGDLNHTMGRVGEFAKRFPNVRIVLDHLGYPNPASSPATFGLTPNHLAVVGQRNLYWKLTSFHLTTRIDAAKADLKGFVDYVAKLYGPDHMMWGSDIGNTPGTLDEHVALLQRMLDATAHMKDADRRAIFFDTADRVFVPGGTGTYRAR
jgi:predicted TIM-barrel fold metal-dependent hydrolase